MEEIEVKEVSVDKVGEDALERAKEKAKQAGWMRWLALSTAIFAVFAAIASMESGKLANESLLDMNKATLVQAQVADQWSYYQAKGIKQTTREAEADILTAGRAAPDVVAQSRNEAARYKADQAEIERKARELENEQQRLQQDSSESLERHHTFALVVTLLQVAIGLSAIAALSEKRAVWLLAVVAGIAGIILLTIGFLQPRLSHAAEARNRAPVTNAGEAH